MRRKPMSIREYLKPLEGARVNAKGHYRAISGKWGAALFDDLEVEVEGTWIQIGHAWVQRADTLRVIDLRPDAFVGFRATVRVIAYPNATKIGLYRPRRIRVLGSGQKPTDALDINLTVLTYSALPSTWRKTEGQRRFARVNGEWRRVVFLPSKKGA
jgi:hypothetical protein